MKGDGAGFQSEKAITSLFFSFFVQLGGFSGEYRGDGRVGAVGKGCENKWNETL